MFHMKHCVAGKTEKIKRKEETKMKAYEFKELIEQIEKDTGRKLKMNGQIVNGKPVVYLYLNDILIRTLFIDEIMHELVTISNVVTALKYGRNQVEF